VSGRTTSAAVRPRGSGPGGRGGVRPRVTGGAGAPYVRLILDEDDHRLAGLPEGRGRLGSRAASAG
jgi:hypothetical protein